MVLVDIFVPSVDSCYNFSLSGDVEISLIINEIVGMIAQKEQTELNGDQDMLNLFSIKDKRVLPKANTLYDCNICNGSSLMLI